MSTFLLAPVIRQMFAALAVAVSLLVAGPAGAADDASVAKLEAQRLELQQIEASLTRTDLRDSDLEGLRRRLDPVRDALQARIAEIEPRSSEIEARLKELGKKPDANAPPEDPKVTAERDDLSKRFSEIDGELKQARVIALRVEQIIERITERRRALFAAEIFARSDGVLTPRFWLQAISAVPIELRSLRYLVRDWTNWIELRSESNALLAALVTLMALGFSGAIVWRWWRRRPKRTFDIDAPQTAKALAGWQVLAGAVLPSTVLVATVVGVLSINALMPMRVAELAAVLTVSTLLAALARGTSLAVLAPEEPARRVIAFSDAEARRLNFVVTWSARAFSAAILLNALHKAVVAPVSLTLATSAAMAIAVVLLVAATLFASRPAPEIEEPPADTAETGTAEPQEVLQGQPWLRAVGWLTVAVLAVALVVGHVGLAAFLTGRLVVAVTLLGITYLAVMLIDAVMSEGLSSTTYRGRRASAMLGIAPGTLDVAGTLVSGLVKLVLYAFAAFVILGPWGVHAVDIAATFSGGIFGLQIGNLTKAAGDVLGALALFGGGLLATRALQRWLELRLLPRTRLDASLQVSVRQIVGYAGFIIATTAAMAELGIDLQSIAIVAGALSFGIGFGLQSIVSNFVSGLILLTERPIRVGDTINVSGEEGYVRRISVRATEIETFERSTVIVPNSQLITGVVKNWTHANTTGRIIIAVAVPYTVDPDMIRDLLVDTACAHPKVMQQPPPRVFLMKFGDMGLHFELRCVVSNVDYSLAVRSDLHFTILHRFRKAGILLPVVPPAPAPVVRFDEASGDN